MRLKVKEAKEYKGKPDKGHPPLVIPLKNGIYANPGQEFDSDLLLGGADSAEDLLEEEPCRVEEVPVEKPKGRGKKGGDK
jgi:hypothetical protein